MFAGAGFNFAAALGPVPPLDEIVPVACTFFSDAEKGWGILVEADSGHPIETQMIERGWAVDEDESAYAMARIDAMTNPVSAWETGYLAGAETRFPKPKPGFELLSPELTIQRVQSAADEAAYHALVVEAFAVPPALADAMAPDISYVGATDIALFVGSFEGTVVSAAGYSRSGPTAVVWGVATLEAYRGRGFGAAAARAALAHAAARGCSSASLRSGPKSRSLSTNASASSTSAITAPMPRRLCELVQFWK